MSEFIRPITPEVFESGLERRLLVGQIAVGQLCKIRIEDLDTRKSPAPMRYVEATISVLNKSDNQDGSTLVDYKYEASKPGDIITDKDIFNAESLVLNQTNGVTVRTYLSDDLDPRWDGSLRALVDSELNATVKA